MMGRDSEAAAGTPSRWRAEWNAKTTSSIERETNSNQVRIGLKCSLLRRARFKRRSGRWKIAIVKIIDIGELKLLKSQLEQRRLPNWVAESL